MPAAVQPTILFYNSFFGAEPDLSTLSVADRQAFTTDRKLFPQADAVVFHIPSLGRVDALPKRPGQLWVLWSMESAINYPCMADPEFLKLFDLRMTYRREAEIWTPYHPAEWEEALKRPLPAKTERAPGVFFQSSRLNQSGRLAYVKELMKHMRIDSYGRVLNNRKLAVEDHWHSTRHATIASYKFSIAMENSIDEDYVTEKFFDPLAHGTVPVYLGAPNVESFAPGDHAYIHVRDFSGPRALAEYLNMLDKDDAAYQKYFEWRRKPVRESFAQDLARRGAQMEILLDTVRTASTARRGNHDPAAEPMTLSYDLLLARRRSPLVKPIFQILHGLGSVVRWPSTDSA